MSRLFAFKAVSGYTDAGNAPILKSALALGLCLVSQHLFAQAQRNPQAITGETAAADNRSATSISREVKDIFGRAARAVVKIHGVDDHSDIFGTGFFVDPTGTLYTAYTV